MYRIRSLACGFICSVDNVRRRFDENVSKINNRPQLKDDVRVSSSLIIIEHSRTL